MRTRRLARAGGVIACSVLALLLWSKLKLVSGIPRTAYAEPRARAAAPPPQTPSVRQPDKTPAPR